MKSAVMIIKEDFSLLRPQLFRLIVIVVFCCLLLTGLFLVKSKFDLKLQNIANDYGQMDLTVRQFSEDQVVVENYLKRYQMIEENGLVQAEERLRFLEDVRNIRNLHALHPISVELGEQASSRLEYGDDVIFPGENVALTSSEIKIRLPLLHEGELVELLESIRELDGAIVPVNCEIDWYGEGEEELVVNEPNLKANCDFQWLGFDLQPVVEEDYEEEFYEEF